MFPFALPSSLSNYRMVSSSCELTDCCYSPETNVVIRTNQLLIFLFLLGGLKALYGQAKESKTVESATHATIHGTKRLTWEDDIASRLVAGVDRFLLRQIEASVEGRAKHWKRDFSSIEKYNNSVATNRKRLAHIVGVRDERVPFDDPELIATTTQSARIGIGNGFVVDQVRWPVIGDIHAEGLLLSPSNRDAVADIVAIPDADLTPEQIAGLASGVATESQFARRLAESGCRVLVPTIVSRTQGQFSPAGGRSHDLTNREFLYRSAFELGRHLIGYEIQKVLAAVDWFTKNQDVDNSKVGVIGWGEGGLIALFSGAIDTRIGSVCVSGFFDSRQELWQQPIDRNVFGLLEQFGDAELASLIVPRKLTIEAAKGPEFELKSGTRGAPAILRTPDIQSVRNEVQRAKQLVNGLVHQSIELIESKGGDGPFCSDTALAEFLSGLDVEFSASINVKPFSLSRAIPNATDRSMRQIREIDRHNQWLLRESPFVRKQFMKKLDTSSIGKFTASAEEYRQFFSEEVIGHFDLDFLPQNARTRLVYDKPSWLGYEVVLDVFPDVIAYGILAMPKNIKSGEKRPVVVCQHGLEGRPQDILQGDHRAYHDFAAKLAERGFITFSPQNLYIFRDRFRTLQRKANSIKKTLFSVIVPQHQQIVNWLKTLPSVDHDRIAFYGLSYGGKSAMRIPPLVPDYCLSICSADFNEWVDKNASTRNPHSYVWTGEYEIFEFDLGSTFNYAEMAALIAPRPFMVERGHFDGVASDETVGWEFAKVRHLYAARLKLPADHCQIEWFDGPHTINGKETYEFLHHHLNWPKPTEED